MISFMKTLIEREFGEISTERRSEALEESAEG